MRLGVLVDHTYRVAGAHPVGRVAELPGDHHHRGKPWRSIPGEPDRWEVNIFAPVLKAARVVGNINRHQLAGVRPRPAQRCQIGQVGLIGQWARGQISPRPLQCRVVAHPVVQRQKGTQQGERNRCNGQTPSPPTRATKTLHCQRDRRCEDRHPRPQLPRRWVGRQPLRVHVGAGAERGDDADSHGDWNRDNSPAASPPTDRDDQDRRRQDLDGQGKPPAEQGEAVAEPAEVGVRKGRHRGRSGNRRGGGWTDGRHPVSLGSLAERTLTPGPTPAP